MQKKSILEGKNKGKKQERPFEIKNEWINKYLTSTTYVAKAWYILSHNRLPFMSKNTSVRQTVGPSDTFLH